MVAGRKTRFRSPTRLHDARLHDARIRGDGESKRTRYEYYLNWLFEPFSRPRPLTAGANAPHEPAFCIGLPVQEQMPQLQATGVA
jgi:hypothetical protein